MRKMSKLTFFHVSLCIVVRRRKDVGRMRVSGKWKLHIPWGRWLLVWFSRDCIFVTCDTGLSWVAELVLVLVATSYTGWNTNPKKFKGKRVLTKDNSCSTPCLFCPILAEASSTYTHLIPVGVIWQKCFHLTFWWTVYGAAGCSLEQADLFWFIHSNSGDNFRAQMTGNNFFCIVHQEIEQGKAPTIQEQELWHAAHAAYSVPLCL